MRPTLRQLESLLAVAEQRSFSAAARQLRISQPAVTRSISDLEGSAGVKLFERTASGVFLTSYGESLLRHARSVVSEIQHAGLELAAMRGAASGRVAVGATAAGAAWIVPSAVEHFAHARPDAGIFIVEASLMLMLGSLRAGDLDLVVAPLARDETTIEFASEELYSDKLHAIVSSSHPAIGSSRLGLKELVKFPWIIPPINTSAGTWVRAMFSRNELALPSWRIETQAMNIVRELLLTNRLPWIAPLPVNIFRNDQRAGHLCRIPLPPVDHLRSIGILTRARAARSPLVAAFIASLREAAKSQAPSGELAVPARLAPRRKPSRKAPVRRRSSA